MTLKNDALKYGKSLDMTGKMVYNNTIQTKARSGRYARVRYLNIPYYIYTMNTFNPNQGEGFVPFFLTIEQVSQLLSLSRSTIDRRERIEKAFPERVKISKRRVGWRSDEIKDYANGTWKRGKK